MAPGSLGGEPVLSSYDWIVVNSSAGKDSQAMLDLVVERATAAGVRSRVVVVHADLGRVEWPGTRALAEEQAKHYGLRFLAVSRRQGDLLEHVEKRGKWPSSTARYCTSDHKRGQVARVMTELVEEYRVRFQPGTACRCTILNCLGLRAEESPARAKRGALTHDEKATNGKRWVDTWLPVHDWTEAQVWARIRASGVRYHPAYDLGMRRLSCVFCVFAPRSALLIAGAQNPSLLGEYVRVEKAIGHSFRQSLPIASIQEALAAGEGPEPAVVQECWDL